MSELSVSDVFEKAKGGTRSDAGTALVGLSAGYFLELLLAAHGHTLPGLSAATASIYGASGLLGLKQFFTKSVAPSEPGKAVASTETVKALPSPEPAEQDKKQKDVVVALLKNCAVKYSLAAPALAQAEAKISRDWSLFECGAIKREQWQKSIDAAIGVLDTNQCGPA